MHRIPTPKGLYATVVHPQIKIRTQDARNILSETVSLNQAVEQTGNIAALVVGMFNSNFDLIGRALNDVIIEPQRAQLIPDFYKVKEAALEAGVLGCSISGAGPSIFALSSNSLIAEKAGAAMQKIFFDNGIDNTLYISTINNDGAILL